MEYITPEEVNEPCLDERIRLIREGVNRGLPEPIPGSPTASFFEFWPAWLFYIPTVCYWLWLGLRYRHWGLPMVVNPKIWLGGMVGESKAAILESAGPEAQSYILPFVLVDRPIPPNPKHEAKAALTKARSAGLEVPCIVKPELGCRGAGVKIVSDEDALVSYIKEFPADRKFMLQALAPYAAEAGVFYERFPGDPQGEVTSITLKYRPEVEGDGLSSLKSLILTDPRARILQQLYLEKNASRLESVPKPGERVALSFAGSHCRGSIFRNGNAYITDALSRKIDTIMKAFPEFHYGRLDIKFRDLHALRAGEDFVIIEVNGVSSEKTHIWDSATGLPEAQATLLAQYRKLFAMGFAMRRKGYAAESHKSLLKAWIAELRGGREYPSTD